MSSITAAVLALLSFTASAHMMLNYPPAFNSSNNPHTKGPADPFLYYPTNCCGRSYADTGPCHGYLSLLGTPAGAPVASWEAGSKQQYSLTGAGNHYGGSCQVGFSTDHGKTFKVATSYPGNCPHRNGGVAPSDQTFDFTVPHDLPLGEAVFAWTFTNREQEFFMNCAAVSITRSRSSNNGTTVVAVHETSPVTEVHLSSVKNAAPSYSMAGCTCTCPTAFQRSADNTFTTGPCHCACDGMPPISKTGGLAARRDLQPRQQQQQQAAYRMGDCACTCAKQAKRYRGGKYETAGCLCTCETLPALSSTGAVQHRAFSIRGVGAVGRWLRRVGGERPQAQPATMERTTLPWNERPEMLFANVVGDCRSPLAHAELAFPRPGPDVVAGDGEYPLELPTGECI